MESFELSTAMESVELSPDAASDDCRANSPLPQTSLVETECTNSTDGNQNTEDAWGIDSTELEKRRAEIARWALVSSIQYLTFTYDGKEEMEHYIADYYEVEYILPYFLHLRAHLRASVKILHTYHTDDFLEPHLVPGALEPTSAGDFEFSDIAKDQILFTHHHSAVSETLVSLERNITTRYMFGLPNSLEFVWARNFFCHSLLTPGIPLDWADRVKSLKGYHEQLLRQVEVTTPLLEGRLADESAWVEKLEEKVEVDVPQW